MRWVLASLALCTLLPSLSVSIANVALPALSHAFQAPFQQVQWVVLAYLLTSTALIVGIGRLGDLLGRRRVLRGGLVLFTAASALAGLAPQLGWLLLARALQGLGAAALMALSLALVSEVVPKNRTGQAMGGLGTLSAVGTALGPSLGGLLLAGLGWRAVFWVQVPLGLLALLWVGRHLPADAPAPDRPWGFDTPGTLLLALGLGAYALAMTRGHGTFGLWNLLLLAGVATTLALLLRQQRRAAQPLLPLERLADASLRRRLLGTGLVATVMMSTLVVGPFFLAGALGLEPAQVGLTLAIGPLTSALSGLPAGRAVDRFGPAWGALLGLSAMVAGCLLLGTWATTLPVYITAIVTLTLGYALFQAANNTAVMGGLPAQQRGVISGLVNLARNLGFITGASVMGAVFAHAAGTAQLLSATPQALTQGLHQVGLGAAGLAALTWWLTWRDRPRQA